LYKTTQPSVDEAQLLEYRCAKSIQNDGWKLACAPNH